VAHSGEISTQGFLQRKSQHHTRVMENELQATGQTEKRISPLTRSASEERFIVAAYTLVPDCHLQQLHSHGVQYMSKVQACVNKDDIIKP